MNDLQGAIDEKIDELGVRISEKHADQSKLMKCFVDFVSSASASSIIKFAPAMIRNIADSQREIDEFQNQIRMLVWLGKDN